MSARSDTRARRRNEPSSLADEVSASAAEDTSTIRFAPLVVNRSNGNGAIIVGRPDVASYAEFDEVGLDLLERLRGGCSPETAARWHLETYGVEVDIADYLATLHELGFILADGDAEAGPAPPVAPMLRGLGRVVFSPAGWLIFAALNLGALYVMWREPQLRPSRDQIFFTDYLSLIEITLVLGQLPGVALHEFCHVLAAARIGVRTPVGIGFRAYDLVAETDLTGLWSAPRRARYLPLVAGMAADLGLFSLLSLLSSSGFSAGPIGPAAPFLRALAFTTLLRLAWQFNLHLKTDIYFLLIHLRGHVNVGAEALSYIAGLANTLRGRPRPQRAEMTEAQSRDARALPVFLTVYAIGYAITAATLFGVVVPTMVRAVHMVIRRLADGHPSGPLMVDAVLTIALNIVQVAAIALIVAAQLRMKRRARSRGSAIQEGR